MAEKAASTSESNGSDKKGAVAQTRFIVSHGQKGGVGKSFTAQAIADFLFMHGEQLAVIDADTANPDVYRMFDSKVKCLRTNLRNESGWMDVVDFVGEHPGHTIILNTPAGIGESMLREVRPLATYLATQETPVALELWWTLNLQHDSVDQLGKALESYGQYFDKIRVVRNLHYAAGDPEQFLLWRESPLRAKLEKSNGMTLCLPGMHVRIVKKLFNYNKIMPFSDAIDVSVGETVGLERSERLKLQEWFREMSLEFGPALGYSKESAIALPG